MKMITKSNQLKAKGPTSAWGNPSLGGASTDSKQFSTANKTRSFPGVGNGTLDTKCAIVSHNGLLKLFENW